MTISYNNADIVLTTAAATVASVGFNSTALFTKATATNTDIVAHTIKLYRVINGGTASASNQIGGNVDYPVPAGGTITIPLAGHTLVNSQMLQALADINS